MSFDYTTDYFGVVVCSLNTVIAFDFRDQKNLLAYISHSKLAPICPLLVAFNFYSVPTLNFDLEILLDLWLMPKERMTQQGQGDFI